jgi:2-octaprenyl-6-methoxyphenol hydroxylase
MNDATPDLPAAPLHLAVIGAGPVGLALALQAARALPDAQVNLFDARAADKDIAGDPRTLALSLGSVQLLERLGVWPAELAQPILEVHVSQQPPSLLPLLGDRFGEPELRIRALDEAVPMLGAVLSYGSITARLQSAWLQTAAAEPQRLRSRFGQPVAALKNLDRGVEIDAGIAERFDLAIVAEGGVFAEQDRKAASPLGRPEAARTPSGGLPSGGSGGFRFTSDYHQNAWVGTVRLAAPGLQGLAIERFTRNGPLALLPLPDDGQGARAALVWCLPQAEDDIATLNDAQRLTVIQQQLPAAAGRVTGISPLKCFPLGLNAETRLLQGRTLRIGNAAQTLHPVAGQGLNLGLRDAQVLVDALRDGAETAADLDAVLARIDRQRAPDRWPMIAATDFLARSFAWRLPGLPALRGLALAGLELAKPLKKAVARRMMFGG